MVQVVLLHGADEVRPGVEVVRAWLLQAANAEETLLVGGAAGKRSAGGDAGVPSPALGLQVERLQRSHGHLSLATTWGTEDRPAC